MSTFSALNTAQSGLNAARAGLDIAGHNIANVNTAGYTRQRVETSAVGALAEVRGSTGQARPGQGVSVDGIARLGDAFLDARVRTTAANGGYTAMRASTLIELESVLSEPGEDGLSARFEAFFAAWQDVSNQPGELAPSGALLEESGVLVSQIAEGYRQVDDLWAQTHHELSTQVAELNSAAEQIAEINEQIRYAKAAGANANELVDRRSTLTATIAAIAGGTVRDNSDGTVDVLVGGNSLVSGIKANEVRLVGATEMSDVDAGPVSLEWTSRPGAPVGLDGGEIAGSLTLLAPAGSGGVLASAAESFNTVAATLAARVNAVHATGVSTTGQSGLAFFSLTAGAPAALSLGVVPTTPDQIATGRPGGGAYDGSVADAISQVGLAGDGPAQLWADFVIGVGVASSSALQHATLADNAAVAASTAQLAGASVDLDEETVNLMTYQRAYQGSARVMTALDEMLEVLINRTGRVGL